MTTKESRPEFTTRTILADADSMTLGELKRAVERAAQLGLAPIHVALQAKHLLRLKLKMAGEANNSLTIFDTAPIMASLSSWNRLESS